jgi:hypothetical protein
MNEPKRWFLALLVLVGLVLPAAVLLTVPPVAQPQWYHQFADQRACCGIANAANVLSKHPLCGGRHLGRGMVVPRRTMPGIGAAG